MRVVFVPRGPLVVVTSSSPCQRAAGGVLELSLDFFVASRLFLSLPLFASYCAKTRPFAPVTLAAESDCSIVNCEKSDMSRAPSSGKGLPPRFAPPPPPPPVPGPPQPPHPPGRPHPPPPPPEGPCPHPPPPPFDACSSFWRGSSLGSRSSFQA